MVDSFLFSENAMRVYRYVIIGISITLLILVFIVIPMTNMNGVVQGEGEIVEISSSGISVVIQHVNYMGMNETFGNPVSNITVGICFDKINDYFRCNIGTKVRVSKYVSAIDDWWSIDAIIKGYSNTTDTFITIH